MPVKKIILSFEDDFELDYHILALHTSIEDFRLAFHLNRTLSIFFQREEKHKICIDINESSNPRFYYCFDDKHEFISYFLLENKHQYSQKSESAGLFADEEIITDTYFIENDRKANFILILKGESIDYKIAEISKKLKKENFIRSIYIIPTDKIKNKHYYDLIA
jgi:hypothetical protein